MLLYPAILNATGLSLNPITIIIGPTTTGGKNDFIFSTPNFKTIKDIITYTSPADIIPPFNIATPCSLKTNAVAPINANDEPKNTGTIPFVTLWNIKVPTPAQMSAIDGLSPVKKGTNTVAPNIASTCCIPKTIFVCKLSFSILIPLSYFFITLKKRLLKIKLFFLH